jgi:hypothetical protein
MKVVKYYLVHYYNFFIAGNPDRGWALTRSVNLFLINFFVFLVAVIVAIFRPMHVARALFDNLYEQYKGYVQLTIVIVCLASSFMLRKYFRDYIDSNPKTIESRLKDKLIIWLTIPGVVALFFIVLIAF